MRLDLLVGTFISEEVVAAVAEHGVGFACTSLAVHEDGAVDAVHWAEDDLGNRLFINCGVPLVFVKASIVGVGAPCWVVSSCAGRRGCDINMLF